MAKFVPLLGELSGTIGANVWSHNKGGAYVRVRAIPTNPNSDRQASRRAKLSLASIHWADITQDQRDAWVAWAATHPGVGPLGETIAWTGHQANVSCNSRLLLIGSSVISDPPTVDAPAPLITASTTASEATQHLSVTYTVSPLAAGVHLVTWETIPAGIGRDPNFHQARLGEVTAAAAESPADLPSRWVFVEGQTWNVFLMLIDDATGLASTVLKTRVTAGE